MARRSFQLDRKQPVAAEKARSASGKTAAKKPVAKKPAAEKDGWVKVWSAPKGEPAAKTASKSKTPAAKKPAKPAAKKPARKRGMGSVVATDTSTYSITVEAVKKPVEEKLPQGRPTDYTEELATRICSMIAEGMSVKTVCSHDGMPSVQTIYTWLRIHPSFLENYNRAKDDQAEALFEELLDIADDGHNDWTETRYGPQVNGEAIKRSQLRVTTRMWMLGRLKPKKYGSNKEEPAATTIQVGKEFDGL